MANQLTNLAVAMIVTGEQVRTQVVSDADEAQLLESVRLHGILQPVGVRFEQQGKYRVVWGHRRLKAAIGAGLKEVPVVILDKDVTEGQWRTMQLLENVVRTDITPFDLWQGCVRLMEANAGWTQAELGKVLSMPPSTVTRTLSPSKCIPAWVEALKAGKVGLADCYNASRLPEDEQTGLLAMRLGGATRDQLEAAGRKKRTVPVAVVKLSRVKCPLSSGTVVTVTGPEMTLEQYLEALTQAREAAVKANKDQLDIKTAEKVWADRAKIGSKP